MLLVPIIDVSVILLVNDALDCVHSVIILVSVVLIVLEELPSVSEGLHCWAHAAAILPEKIEVLRHLVAWSS